MFYLFIWAIVIQYPVDARYATAVNPVVVKEWKNMGEFHGEKACNNAAAALGYTKDFRCIYSR